MQELAQRDKLLRDKAEKVKALNKYVLVIENQWCGFVRKLIFQLCRDLAKARKKEKRTEQFLSPPDEYEGWLWKQGKKNKVQRRWCVLRYVHNILVQCRHINELLQRRNAVHLQR